jgi:transposase-like protein
LWYRENILAEELTMGSVVKLKTKREPAQLLCSSCYATSNASCDCGVAYIPAGKAAAKAIANNPQMSDRAIARELGVNQSTVSRARTDANASVERTGLDGKTRKMPRKYEPPPRSDVQVRFDELRERINKLHTDLHAYANEWCMDVKAAWTELETFRDKVIKKLPAGEERDKLNELAAGGFECLDGAMVRVANQLFDLKQDVEGR